MGYPKILSIASDNPGMQFSQMEVYELLNLDDDKQKKIFLNSHIESRYLSLPDTDELQESSLQLWHKHKNTAVESAKKVVLEAINKCDLSVEHIDYIACVTSTGFLCPGISALLTKSLKLRSSIHRMDIVGMGCNAGLNAIQPIVNFCRLNPDKVGILVCVEICSAIYSNDRTTNSAVVNSLFGDGAVAVVIGHDDSNLLLPKIIDFESLILTDYIDSMKYNFDGNRFSFFLEKEIPFVIGRNVSIPVDKILERNNLKVDQIDHWIIHSGGKKVIDAIRSQLGLHEYHVRHTLSVLSECGNLSSGSFLFSLEKLLNEGVVKKGEKIMMITMGPGTSIECCLASL